MKASRLLFPFASVLVVLCSSHSQAASASWTSVTSGDWSTGPWSTAYPNGTSETATFNQNWNGQTINVNGTYTVGSILATDTTSGGGLTISGGTLILNNGANKPIISTDSNNAFSETASTRLKITSVLDGSNGFERQGSGYLDLSGSTNIFTGTVKLTALASGGGSFTVINNDANLGNANNTIEIATNAQPVGFYNDASAGSFTLNSARTITTTGTGDFWVKNKSGANMTIAGVISGTANFRKNDGGIVTLTGANTYAGTTKLEGGTLRVSGGSNRLPTGTTLQFIAAGAALDLTNTSQSVAAVSAYSGGTSTITGTGGSLTVTNNANFTVNGADATVLDMSGLTNFTYNQSTKNFVVQPVINGTTSNNTVNLAKAGTNNITALNVTVGGASGTSAGTAHEGRLYLGTANNINTSTVNLGGFNGSGLVAFQSGLTTPELKLRGLAGGTSRVDNVFAGSTSSGVRSGDGVMNLGGGNLDAMVTNLIINRHGASATTTQTSSLTMGGGSVDATNIVLARKSTNFGTGVDTTGNPVLNANFTQNGGTVKVSNMVMGENTNADVTTILPVLKPTYNLNGGTLYAATIDGGVGGFNASSSIRNLNLNGGTLRNYDSATNLTVDGVDTSAGGRLNVNVTSSSTIHADVGRTITLEANTALAGSGSLSKNGDGTLIINGATSTYTGAVTVTAGTLLVTGQLGASSVTVNDNAKLAGSGTIGGSVVFSADGKLDFGSTLSVNGATVTFGSGFDMANILGLDNSAEEGTYTLISGGADVDLTGVSNVGLANAYDLGGGKKAYFQEGSLQVVVIPEPGAALLGGIGTLLLLRRRRS